MTLTKYKQKRNFEETPEPGPVKKSSKKQLRFTVQRHQASHLHYDLRLEMEGLLKSWAVPKGPSMDPKEKRLAVNTEDHPYKYLDFHGHIPEGNYGAGDMEIWDTGTYHATGVKGRDESEKALLHGYNKGHIQLTFKGKKLKGDFDLIHTERLGEKSWLLIKRDDKYAVDGGYSAEDHLGK
jgi:bifunctional non-homologous end joining protein LigD